MIKEGSKIRFNIVLKAIDKYTGEVLQEETTHNIMVDAGLIRIIDLLIGDSVANFEYIAIGEGTTTPTANDTALETEATRALATVSQSPNKTAKFEKVFSFGSGESYAITEVGIFDSLTVSGSTMMNRATNTAINVDSDINLSVTVNATVADA